MAVPISNMTTNWSDGALHTAIKMNVTDTSSNAASLLQDLQVGSTSMFNVTKGGIIVPKWIHWDGGVHNNDGFTVTNSTTLVDITGLSFNGIAGRTYTLNSYLMIGVAGGGGIKTAVGGNASTSFAQCIGYIVDTNAIKGQGLMTTLGGVVVNATSISSSSLVYMVANVTVSVSGTLTIQMAQNTASAAGVTATWSNLIAQDVT